MNKEKSKYFRCPVCNKLIIFGDEIERHCFTEHAHSAEYLQGYKDAIESNTEINNGINTPPEGEGW